MLIYTPQDIKTVVDYAAVRGVDVVMVRHDGIHMIGTDASRRRLTLPVTPMRLLCHTLSSSRATKRHLGPPM